MAAKDAPVTLDVLERIMASNDAAVLRMVAHSFDSQGDLLKSMAEELLRQADRREHGGALPDLHVVEDREEQMIELPRIRPMTEEESDRHGAIGVAFCEPNGNLVRDEVLRFLANFHSDYRCDPAFADVFNDVAAGRGPTVEVAVQVTSELNSRRQQ